MDSENFVSVILFCRSCDLIRNCTGADRGDYTWNEKHHSARKKGLLLHCAGTEVQELFDTLQVPGLRADAGEDNADEYQKALRKLDAHFDLT